jgi:hypothetical protein
VSARRRAIVGARRPALGIALGIVLVLARAAAIAGAQIPLLPVLQNGFIASGTSVAIDGGGASGEGVLVASGSFAPRSGDIGVAAGIGSDLGAGAALALGIRAAVPLRFFARRSAFGAVLFAGVGGNTAGGPASRLDIPLGLGVGYRHNLGATRGISVYATPFYFFERRTPSGGNAVSDGSFRAALGTDVTIAPRVGVTVGADAGTRGRGRFGGGISYLIRP